ncbi:MAG TPA: TIGR02391 family protein [Rhizomicrobium sp.]|nr:TIGR02391 family protein [Rhizomicrobium sp.]
MLESPLQRAIPKADDLLRMSVEQLAPVLLKLAHAQRQQAGFIPSAVCDIAISDGYPGHKKAQVETHLARAWNWIERKGLIEPSPGINGQNGWRMFSEEGEAVVEGARLDAVRAAQELPLALLHQEVIAKCRKLYDTGHYAEAVEKSFRVVRDRLRALTGHEKGSDAFGKTKLHIQGAIAPHVDKDFNEAVKFLTMAIDMFRNEKTHTSETGVNDPIKALQYLVLSSLAMRLLDGAEISP